MTPFILGGNGNRDQMDGTAQNGSRFAGRTDAGIKYKPDNEDRIVGAPDDNCFAVIDGVGGHSGGERAAHIVAEEIIATPVKMADALQSASQRMRQEHSQGSLPGMAGACVMTARMLTQNDNSLTVESYHAGDVKRLIIRNRQKLLKNGLPSYDESIDHDMVRGLSREEVRVHFHRNVVLKYISADQCAPENMESRLSPGSLILLYSDGVSDNIPAEEMVRLSIGKSVAELLAAVWEITGKKMTEYTDLRARTEDMKRDNRSFLAIEIP